jgi:molybdopterin-guanine dinucleotide biosynthesis protein A
MVRAGGIVLCGGKSSRMGRSKAWLPFGPETLLQRVVRILSECASPIVVVAAPEQELPAIPSEVLIARDDREHLGPLSGLAAGLAAIEDRTELAYLSSCDVPFLKPALVRRVVDRIGDADVCLPEVGGYKHPLAAVYRTGVLPIVWDLLAANRLRPVFVAEAVRTRLLTEADLVDVDPSFESLRNLNTPEDYERALRDAGYRPG